MNSELVCWKCGASLKALPLPLGRRAECLACGAELHVCRLCRHFDTRKAKQCRELAADEVKNKTRANFCDWFQPKAGAFGANAASTSAQPNPLDSLFGGASTTQPTADTRSELDKLFGKD
jgi:ribosome-binding protein aMBF1 (putative translation factor)